MSTNTRAVVRVLALICAAVMFTPALAAKPDSPGQGKGKGHSESSQSGKEHGSAGQGSGKEHGSSGQGSGKGSDHPGQSSQGKSKLVAKKGVHFDDRQRSLLHDWFVQEYNRGSCPPGLAKKRNGCMPPGLAKQWHIGRVLPRDVIYYSLPAAILRELGRAPDGHKYVRVGADILLLAIGTGLVIDAIEDLSSL